MEEKNNIQVEEQHETQNKGQTREETHSQEEPQHLSKSQRKRLKREQKEREREQEHIAREKRKRNKKLKNYAVLFVIALLISAFIYWKITLPKDAPILTFDQDSYNFGTVYQSKGVVSGEMSFTNTGVKDLIIEDLATSCGCTEASIIKDGVESKKFGMNHGSKPSPINTVIAPGETANLKIYYDPNVHKELRGSVSRSVVINSNDPRHSSKEIRINLVQVD